MFLEAAIGLAIVLGVGLYWHSFTRPERVLDRLVRALHVPPDVTRLYQGPDGKLALVRDELENRYDDAWTQVAGVVYEFHKGDETAQAFADMSRWSNNAPSAAMMSRLHGLLDPIRDDVRTDDSESIEELEDRLNILEEDCRVLEKLERIHAERACAA